MKTNIFVFVVVLVCVVLITTGYGQDGDINCPVNSSFRTRGGVRNVNASVGAANGATLGTTGSQDLVILFVDYPEGRIYQNGQYLLPTVDADTMYFPSDTQVESVGGMGYVVDSTGHLRKKIRKYTYDDYWDMYFSVGSYYFGTRHPDNASHGILAYGSMRDYYREVSYNSMDIVPYQTRTGTPDKYHTGIVNAIDEANGIKYVRWIMMPNSKSSYIYDGQIKPPYLHSDIDPVLRNLYNQGQISFNVDTYQGRIIIIGAGGFNGGIAESIPGRYCSVREKRYSNYDNQSTLDGIWVSVHEFGHLLGFTHLASGSYDPMNVTLRNGWTKHLYCPPHFNPLYKLQAGWISTNDFTKLHSNSTLNLSPSNSNHNFATITLYGDAMRNNNASHSEYFVLEYRPRNGFNRFAGGQDPTSFPGGVLIWHYSQYGAFTFSSGAQTNIGLKIYNYCDANNIVDNMVLSNAGDTSHFFYAGNNSIDSSTNPNTNSIVHLTTGISMSNFSVANNQIAVTVNYNLGAVPTYSQFFTDGDIPSPISGNIYIGGGNFPSSLTVSDSSHVEFAPGGGSIYTSYLSANASSQNSISFQGVGFGSSRVPWGGIILQVDNSSQRSSITKCLINGVTSNNGFGVTVFISNSGHEPIIANNQFQNCTTDLFLDQSGTSFMEIGGYDNNSFSNLWVAGKWKLTSSTAFTVPSGSIMTVLGSVTVNSGTALNIPSNAYIAFTNGTSLTVNGTLNTSSSLTIPAGVSLIANPGAVLKFASNISLTVNGTLNANGATFTSISGTSWNSWGSITIDGEGASANLDHITMQYGNVLQFLNGANGTLQYSKLLHTTNGVLLNCSEARIANDTISEVHFNAVRGINGGYYPTIGDNVITNPGNLCAKGIFLCTGACGHVYHNDIKGFYSGISVAFNSTALLSIENDSILARDNRIRNCHIGLEVDFGSFVDMMYWDGCGHNSIYNNDQDDLFVGSSSQIGDKDNYYGGGNPIVSVDSTSMYCRIGNPLTIDPWLGFAKSALASSGTGIQNQSTSANQNSGGQAVISPEDIKEFIKGRQYEHQKDYINAMDQYKKMVAAGKLTKMALTAIARIGTKTADPGFVKYFESLKDTKTAYQADVMQLLSGIYLRNGEKEKGAALYDAIIAAFPGTYNERNAWFLKFYYTLYAQKDTNAASHLLDKIISKYSEDDPENEIEMAQLMLDPSKNLTIGDKDQVKKESTIEKAAPNECKLSESYPNPFNPTTVLSYQLPAVSRVNLKVFDILGRDVTSLVNDIKEAGYYTATFDGSKLSSGIYFARLTVQPKDGGSPIVQVRKMLLTK